MDKNGKVYDNLRMRDCIEESMGNDPERESRQASLHSLPHWDGDVSLLTYTFTLICMWFNLPY